MGDGPGDAPPLKIDKKSSEKKARLLAALDKGMVMIHVDARRPGVIVPTSLRNEVHLRLNLSYRFDPPDLTVGEWGVRSTLSFSGSRFTVAVPWTALFAITSHATEESWLDLDDMPTPTDLIPPHERELASREATLGQNHPDVADLLDDLAGLYSLQGNNARAEPLYERALAIRESALGQNHPDVADSLRDLANLYKYQKNYARADPLYERALAIQEAALGQNHPDVAKSLHDLAGIYESQGHYARAKPLYERELAIREAALGQNHPDVADLLDGLAGLYSLQGNNARAEPLYERALAIREAALGQNHPDVADSLRELADLYKHQENYARAEPLLQRALAIQEAALGQNHPDVAKSLHDLAGIYEAQGHYARAEPLYERARAIGEAILGQNHPDVASLRELAALYMDQEDYARAEPLLQRALAIQEATLGQNHPDVANWLHHLAYFYNRPENHTRAEPLFERALAIREAALGPNHPDVADSLHHLAYFYNRQENYTRAEPLLQRALAIREMALGPNHPDVADSLHHLAEFYKDRGNYARAESLLRRALAIRETALGKYHPDVADLLDNLAKLYMDRGNYARAESLLQRALAIRETALGKHHYRIAYSLDELASIYTAQGNFARAAPLYERALAIEETTFGKHHPNFVLSLNTLAYHYEAQEQLAKALPLFARAFTISEKRLRQKVLGLSEIRLASTLRDLRWAEELTYALVHAYPHEARVRHLALSTALLRKGRSVEELADTSRIIYRSLSQADRELFKRLRSLRTQLSTLSLAGPRALAPAKYQQRLQELARQGDALETDLARRSAPLRALHALPPPDELIDRVTAALPSDGALIEFVAYNDGSLVPKPARPGTRASQTRRELRYLALLLFPDGRTSALDLGPAAPIDRAALRLHQALARRSVAYQPAAQELYKLAFRPLMPFLGKSHRLYLSPDSQLSLVPFAALHDGSHFLVDSFDITYLTSGKDLLPRSDDLPPTRSVVVLADPDFSSTPATSSAQAAPAERSASLERFFSNLRADVADQPWPPLPGTRKEAEAIQRLLPHAQLLLGPAATKEALLKLDTPGVLHVATHGFFLEDGPAPADTRAVKAFGAVGESGPQQRPPDPLLRSGLVLAGVHASAAQPGSSRREDSLVTALELAGMDLWGTQLVVLSACDTGRGDVKLGEGVYGLRRSLVVAGAETLVTSLWKVNDETTRELMESYYGNLLAGQGRAAALREAMRVLRKKQPHPHFWAPFIAIGQDSPLRELAPHTEAQSAP